MLDLSLVKAFFSLLLAKIAAIPKPRKNKGIAKYWIEAFEFSEITDIELRTSNSELIIQRAIPERKVLFTLLSTSIHQPLLF